MYVLEDNGQLWSFDGSAWARIDIGVAAFGVDRAGTEVFVLEGNGNLRLFVPAANTLSVKPLATSITALGVTPAGSAFFLDDAGNLRQYADGAISSLDSGVASFQLDAAGN